jgi:23S rRNA (cytosine1962-C5)-methyltransferase
LPYVIEALFSIDEKNLFERSTGQIRKMDGLSERTRWLKCDLNAEEKFEVSCKFADLNMNFFLNKAQKTGLFLDQRSNLNFLTHILKNANSFTLPQFSKKSFLDICSYAGAWSAIGAKNGVDNFTLIDQDAFALKLAEKNILLNSPSKNLDQVKIQSIHGDMFEQLSILSKQNKKFDIVIADPPAFAKSSKHIFEAKRAYIRLIKLAASLTAENGHLIVCSCSRHINDELFLECVTQALENNNHGKWILMHKGEQSPCHTRLIQTELADYLKCYYLQKR